ncbi:MAG TPA: SCO1664 family protein [Actinomycetes bacterium]|nr:SCO1664 family protein [Actinomycetes bacterium]
MDSDPTSALTPVLSHDAAMALLRDGDIDVVGRLVDASNATLFCRIQSGDVAASCIYKPRAGERPLWDFPTGTLSRREVAAFEVSQSMSWNIVPPTVWRDGPFGPGMVQLWIDVDETVDLVELVHSETEQLRRIAVFDVVINNADRKGGHLLPTANGELFGIDHGVAFSIENKVRTLLWQWEGEPLPVDTVADLQDLAEQLRGGDLSHQLVAMLDRQEILATKKRVSELLRTGVHPGPGSDWPAIPWPPF